MAAVDRADVVLIVIDASEGFTEQDTKVAGIAHDEGKACVFVINKWDLVEKDNKTLGNFTKEVKEKFIFYVWQYQLFHEFSYECRLTCSYRSNYTNVYISLSSFRYVLIYVVH